MLTPDAASLTKTPTGIEGFDEIDCVVRLGQHVTGGVAHRDLRVSKYRGSAVHEGVFPMIIGESGIEVAAPIPREMRFPAFAERVSSGVGRLDTMLGGGYFRGSTVLVTGARGTSQVDPGRRLRPGQCRARRALPFRSPSTSRRASAARGSPPPCAARSPTAAWRCATSNSN